MAFVVRCREQRRRNLTRIRTVLLGVEGENARIPLSWLPTARRQLHGDLGRPNFATLVLRDPDYAAIRSAFSSISGNALPRLSALRRIPAHAFAERKYLGGIDPSGSSTEDKDTAPALRYPEVLSVQ